MSSRAERRRAKRLGKSVVEEAGGILDAIRESRLAHTGEKRFDPETHDWDAVRESCRKLSWDSPEEKENNLVIFLAILGTLGLFGFLWVFGLINYGGGL